MTVVLPEVEFDIALDEPILCEHWQHHDPEAHHGDDLATHYVSMICPHCRRGVDVLAVCEVFALFAVQAHGKIICYDCYRISKSKDLVKILGPVKQ